MRTHINRQLALGAPVPVVLTVHILNDVCVRAFAIFWGDKPNADTWQSTACFESLFEATYTYHRPGHFRIRVIAIDSMGQSIERDELDIRIGSSYLQRRKEVNHVSATRSTL